MSKIVVGIDGSEESARALDWAVEEAQLRGLRLEVVATPQPEWLRYGPLPLSRAWTWKISSGVELGRPAVTQMSAGSTPKRSSGQC